MKLTNSKIALGAMGACAAALIVFLAVFDWNWMRGPVERYVYNKTGRHLAIGGDIHVSLGFAPTVRVGKVRYENPAWSKDREMGTVEELEFVPRLWPLLQRKLIIERLRLVAPDVLLERSEDGRRNWVMGKSDDPDAVSPVIQSLSIDRGVVRMRDPLKQLDARFEVNKAVNEALSEAAREAEDAHAARMPTTVVFSGSYKKVPFQGKARTGDLLTLRDTSVAFPLRGRARVGDSSIEVDGSVADMMQLSGIDARVKVSGPDWSRLYPVFPLPLPASPPFVLEGRLKNEGDNYSYEGFKGTIGASDIAGSAVFTAQEPRPHLAATLNSRVLDLKDLGPMIGLRPVAAAASANSNANAGKTLKTAAAAASSPTLAKRADSGGGLKISAAQRGGKVLPNEPFRLERLNAIDADVTFKARQIRRPEALPLEDLSATLHLAEGVMIVNPLDFGFAGGHIVSSIHLNAKRDPIATKASVSMRAVKLDKLFPTVALMKGSQGALGARVQISGRGNSLATMLAHSTGQAGFAVTGGELSNLLVEFLGLDGGEIIKFLVKGDKKTAIRCGVASFDVKDGVAASNVIVFDTDDTRIEGSGTLNLRDEKLDIVLKPHPKDVSILVLRSPIHLQGSFGSPAYNIDRQGLMKRGGSALLMGLINPLAALIPLIETGRGEDADCKALLAGVEGAAREAAKPPARVHKK